MGNCSHCEQFTLVGHTPEQCQYPQKRYRLWDGARATGETVMARTAAEAARLMHCDARNVHYDG